MDRILSTIAFIVVICCLGPSTARAQELQPATSPPEIAAINAAMEGFVESGQIAGAVTLVGHQGRMDELATQPLAFEPGSKWQYSPGVSVAGRIVEIASGQPLEAFMQERIFAPLKMYSTTFFPDAKLSVPGQIKT